MDRLKLDFISMSAAIATITASAANKNMDL